MTSIHQKKNRGKRWLWIAAASLPFAILMAVRETSPSVWIRAASASMAVVFLASVYAAMKRGE